MNQYTVKFPNYTIGDTAIENIKNICSTYGSKALVIGGKTALNVTKEKLDRVFNDANIEVVNTLWYGGECSGANVAGLLKEIEKCEIDYVIGVGGGRALDTAKAVADKISKPIFTVPTTAATCAATTKLSVVYNEHGVFETFYFYNEPPTHVFIDTQIIAEAPAEYFRAGMGDTLAKHYECSFASEGRELDHNSGLAKAMSIMCVTPLLQYGEKALKDCTNNQSSYEVQQVILANIVTTGLVSMLIEEDYNGAVAHSVFYGLTILPHIEERYLHGDVVGYGVLVQLMLEGKEDEARKLFGFYKNTGIPTCLSNIEVDNTREVLMPILEDVATQPDMVVVPYKITAEMLYEAIQRVEAINHN